MKVKAKRLKIQQEFESDLIDIVVKYSQLLTDTEISHTVNRFIGKVLETGR